jgi:helix-turn-helix protein
MSEGERKLVDTSGDYCYAVRSGEPLPDADWRSCRVVLTDRRLVLANNSGKQAVPHGQISLVDDPEGRVPERLDAAGATPLAIGENLILVDAQGIDGFESELCRAILHGEVILVRHPAVVGGVVQDDADWGKARFRFDEDHITLGLPGNRTTRFPIDDVGTIETEEATVQGETRTVVRVEHTDDEGRSVETHFSGTDSHARALETLLTTVIEAREGDYELSDVESQVLMALYSGVSPFEIADFVGIEVEEVEDIYGRLLDIGAVDKVRERTEVTLNAQGRNMASEAMNER